MRAPVIEPSAAKLGVGHPQEQLLTATAPSAVVNAFNARIAAADVAGLTALLTSDHVFVDAFGTRLEGKDAVSAAWKSFFELFPGYWNEVDSILESGQTIIIAGRGHCRDARLDGPALWRALVRDGQVAEWQVYRDTSETRNALGL